MVEEKKGGQIYGDVRLSEDCELVGKMTIYHIRSLQAVLLGGGEHRLHRRRW